MTNKCKTMLIAAVLAWMGASAPAADAGEALSTSGDIGVFSQYIWRGMQQTATPSVQGDLGVSTEAGVSANVWFASLNNNATGGGQKNEFDFTLDYTKELDALSVSAGAIFYGYLNNGAGNDLEVYLGVGYGPVSATYYYSVSGAWKKDAYLDLSASAEAAGFSFGVTAGIYFPTKTGTGFPTTKTGLGHVDLSMSRDVELAGGVNMTPSLMLSIPTWKGHPHNANGFVAGLNLSY